LFSIQDAVKILSLFGLTYSKTVHSKFEGIKKYHFIMLMNYVGQKSKQRTAERIVSVFTVSECCPGKIGVAWGDLKSQK
jgi:hypothetical protein